MNKAVKEFCEHSPLPWKAANKRGRLVMVDADGTIVLECAKDYSALDLGNMAFIAGAVNAFCPAEPGGAAPLKKNGDLVSRAGGLVSAPSDSAGNRTDGTDGTNGLDAQEGGA